jgi:outer membrane immunogenic protein
MKWGAVIGGVALAALVSLPVSLPASAADMTPVGQRAATSGYIPAQFLWTGYYVGAGVGGGWGTSTFTDPFNGGIASPKPKGFLVGGVTGINYQIGAVVIGVEGDFTGTGVRGSVVDTPVGLLPANTLQTEIFWTASITGRVGVAFDRLLVYGKGGGAFAYDRETAIQPSGAVAAGSLNRAGWTVGGGVEYAITEHWIGRLEYDYFRFATRGIQFSGNTVPVNPSGTVGFNLGEFLAIMSYKF